VSQNTLAVAAYISMRLEDIATELDISIPSAWCRVAAQMLGYDLDDLDFLTNRDVGIDFYARSIRIFEVFQCKMHDPLESGALDLAKSFGPEGFDDLLRAAEFLLGSLMPANIDPRLLAFREQLREELSLVPDDVSPDDIRPSVSLALRLITLGDKLSPATRAACSQLRKRVKELACAFPALEVTVIHSGISDLAEFFESPDAQPRHTESIRLSLSCEALKFKEPHDASLRTDSFVTFFTPAADLVSAARKEGPALFDANVRYELANSHINEEIKRTASHPRTMKVFHLYNNGVTIAGRGWAYRDGHRIVEVREPAVINGCQTIRTLARVKKELEEDREGNPHAIEAFDQTCLVQVRLLNRDKVDIEEVVRAANTQNAMEPRNLLSNRSEQRVLEREVAELGWFYERKDGSVDALREAKKTSLGVPLMRFLVRREGKGRKTLRSCDNREIARRWLSFFGYSDEGKNKRNQHFPPDGKGLYERVFLQTPGLHRDVARSKGGLGGDSPMEPGRPPSVWLLYSYHLFELIRYLLPQAPKLRGAVRRELTSKGVEPTLAAVNKRILGDEATRLAFALSMLDHVVLQLAGLAIARALGEDWLAPAPGKRLLTSGLIGHFHTAAQFPETPAPEAVLDLSASDVKADPALIAIRLAVQAIESTLKQPEFESSFLASERKSRYLQADQLLRAYAEKVDQYDRYFARDGNFGPWWDGGSPISAIAALARAA
jgi:hypothetical protein